MFALPAVMLYLELSLFAMAMGLCAGILLAGLAAWGTSKGNNEPPVRPPCRCPMPSTTELREFEYP